MSWVSPPYYYASYGRANELVPAVIVRVLKRQQTKVIHFCYSTELI